MRGCDYDCGLVLSGLLKAHVLVLHRCRSPGFSKADSLSPRHEVLWPEVADGARTALATG